MMLRLLVILFFVSRLSFAQSDAQSEVKELLQQTAKVCKALYLNGYAVDIKRTRYAQMLYQGGTAAVSAERNTLPIPPAPKPLAAENVIMVARSGKVLRYSLRAPVQITNDSSFDWITDGQTTWRYVPYLNSYTETQADPWPEKLGPGRGLPGIEWLNFTKFLAIASASDRARLTADDVAPTNACPGASAIVEFNFSDDRHKETERLHILTKSHLPCQSEIHIIRDFKDYTENTTWSFHAEPPDPSSVAFTPPKNAKKVKRFAQSGRSPMPGTN